ncbi:glycosyltransferase WbpX [Hyphomonas oceanitis SCH89]|uniref:Glycosyltransferase WbpX n=1 Tax=Hyphomonas oceanitis SCH89 TaxID=1280953 RepID=A0A059G2E8_9PROT|nr:glycosyltransferase WbpX [Hyphomonas oceanitis SCH89]
MRYASDTFVEEIALNSKSAVISCGLDWDHKDMRTIYNLKKRDGFRYLAVVYDLIPVTYPHFVVPGYDSLLRDYIGELVWLADKCFCISETTRQDLMNYAAENGLQDLDAVAFPLGNDLPKAKSDADVTSPTVELPRRLANKRFALFVSTIEPRKNHRVLYEAWDRCVREGRVDPREHCLVFVGRQGWGSDDLVREIGANPATKSSIMLLNHVTDEMLGELYRQCAFGLFPSHYEGYGLPLAELLLAGKASFASNAGALSEIGGDLVVRLDPKDTLAWADCLSRAMTDVAYVGELAARVKSDFRPTIWKDAAQEFFAKVGESATP